MNEPMIKKIIYRPTSSPKPFVEHVGDEIDES